MRRPRGRQHVGGRLLKSRGTMQGCVDRGTGLSADAGCSTLEGPAPWHEGRLTGDKPSRAAVRIGSVRRSGERASGVGEGAACGRVKN